MVVEKCRFQKAKEVYSVTYTMATVEYNAIVCGALQSFVVLVKGVVIIN